MGRRMRVAALLVLATIAGGSSSARAQQSWADGLFTEHGFDFGPVPRGAVVRHQFLLTNRYAETLTILDVRASCGCTTGRAGATTIEPGKTSFVEAQMDTRNFVGRKATKLIITLMTAAGQSGEAQLAVVSNILPDIVLNPGTIDFGSLSKGQAPKLTMTIERVGAPDWRFTKMTATDKTMQSIHAEVREVERSAGRVAYELSVSLKKTAAAGYLRDEIRIATNDPDSPSVPVLITAQIQGTVSATPSVLAMGRATNNGAQGRFLVRGTRAFAIKSLAGEGDGFTVAADDATRKNLHVVTVTYRALPTSMRGDLRKTFRITTDLDDEPPIDVNATLRVEP